MLHKEQRYRLKIVAIFLAGVTISMFLNAPLVAIGFCGMAFGILLNLLVSYLNGGKMPVANRFINLHKMRTETMDEEWKQRLKHDRSYGVVTSDTKCGCLGDVFYSARRKSLFSIGDAINRASRIFFRLAIIYTLIAHLLPWTL